MCGVVIRELPAAAPTLGTIACWPQPPAHAPRVRHGQPRVTRPVASGQVSSRDDEGRPSSHLLTLLLKLDGVHCFAQEIKA